MVVVQVVVEVDVVLCCCCILLLLLKLLWKLDGFGLEMGERKAWAAHLLFISFLFFSLFFFFSNKKKWEFEIDFGVGLGIGNKPMGRQLLIVGPCVFVVVL